LTRTNARLSSRITDPTRLSGLIFDLTIILSNVINKPKEFIYAHPDFILNPKQQIKFWWLTKKYQNHYPVAYLTGHKEFFGLDFSVTPDTLIPRPDTEIMVAEAIKILNENQNCTLIDMGTGSGCIPISILKNIKNTVPAIAVDISRAALNVAHKNAKKHQVKIDFRIGNLFAPIKSKDLSENLLITANLPYLTLNQTTNEQSIKREPWSALYGGYDGLEFYRQLIDQITNFCKTKKPNKIWLLLEIDPTQHETLKNIITQKIPTAKIKTQLDLAGLERLIILEF